MAEIILFRPKEIYSKTISYHRAPLGLLHITAHLTASGLSVKIVDTETTGNWQNELCNATSLARFFKYGWKRKKTA